MKFKAGDKVTHTYSEPGFYMILVEPIHEMPGWWASKHYADGQPAVTPPWFGDFNPKGHEEHWRVLESLLTLVPQKGYKVAIRNNATGELRIATMDVPDDGATFWWKDGNMSCDCNRELEWLRAGGQHEEAEKVFKSETVCSTGRFTVPYIELRDGKRLEIDRAKEETPVVPQEGKLPEVQPPGDQGAANT